MLGSRFEGEWPSLTLYTPSICIAEALGIFGRWHFCTWWGPLRKHPEARIPREKYLSAQQGLAKVVQSHDLLQLSPDPELVLAAGLVSPINNAFRDCAQTGQDTGKARPMGGMDCLIAATAILLAHRLGKDSVALVTTDQRLTSVMARARCLSEEEVRRLALDKVADQLSFTWSSDLYPRCVDLSRADPPELRDAFLGWPLPMVKLDLKSRTALTACERQSLTKLWYEVKSEHSVSDVDTLPYSPALDDLRTRFAVQCNVHMQNEDIYRFLQNQRKAGKLASKPSCRNDEQSGAPGLFDDIGYSV